MKGGIRIGQHDAAAPDGIVGFEANGAGLLNVFATADVAPIEARVDAVMWVP